MDPLKIISNCKFVMDQAIHVSIDRDQIPNAVKILEEEAFGDAITDLSHRYKGDEDKSLAYLFVLDALNFCFWALQGQKRWEFEYEGKRYNGYFALAYCLRKAFEEGIPLWDVKFLSSLSPDEFFSIFQADGTLTIMHRRYECLRELGHVTMEVFGGKFSNIIRKSRNSAIELVRNVTRYFEIFDDTAYYKKRIIPIYKRAQLLAWDIYLSFGGESYGKFSDIDQLTAFADYKLPQVLRELGILKYSKELSDLVDKGILLPSGSPMEVEIRAATIISVEYLKEEFRKRGTELRSVDLDAMLWHLGQKDKYRKRPYHKTITIFY